MKAIIERNQNTIKYPYLLINDELFHFVNDNSLKFVDEGSYLLLGEDTTNRALYQKEVYGKDIIYKKA